MNDHRKVEGEGKGEAHGTGGGKVNAEAVPLRRWEDWERSRLRKLRREERRWRDFERMHPSGYVAGNGELLSVHDTRSQYDGSDTVSVASSDDDHWGPQIGGYNEHHALYPPPPTGLLVPHEALQTAETVDNKELEAMLEMGFDDRPTPPLPSGTYNAPRYQLQDGLTSRTQLMDGNGYAPLTRSTSPTQNPPPPNMISPTSPTFTMSGSSPSRGRGRGPGRGGPSIGARGEEPRYGPLGPLDPGTRI